MHFLDVLPGIIGGALGFMFRDAVLIKPGARTSDGRGGFVTGPAVNHACKALVEDFSDLARAGGVPVTDRKLIVLGTSLPANAYPARDDRFTVEGRTYSIIAVSRDPAGATWECQAR